MTFIIQQFITYFVTSHKESGDFC